MNLAQMGLKYENDKLVAMTADEQERAMRNGKSLYRAKRNATRIRKLKLAEARAKNKAFFAKARG